MLPAVPALLGCNLLIDDLDDRCGICRFLCSLEVMVDASESLSLARRTRSATVCWRFVIRCICCSIRSLAVLFDSAKAAIICICWAMMVSNSDFLMDLVDATVEAIEANGESVPVSCRWSSFVSNVRIRSSSCCSRRDGAVIRELVGELIAD